MIPHCNICILRAWSPGSGLNDGAWEWKRQRGNIGITLWDSRVINRNTPPLHLLFGWLKNFLWDTLFPHTIYVLVTALFPTTPRVITTYSAPTKHQGYPGSCQEVFPPLPLRCSVRYAGENLRVWVLVCFLPYYHTKPAHRFPKDIPVCTWLILFVFLQTTLPEPPHSLLYLSNMPQVVQERWRRCLGSW